MRKKCFMNRISTEGGRRGSGAVRSHLERWGRREVGLVPMVALC